jgi:glutamate transport system permease protein
MSGSLLYDVQGPRARRRVLVYSVLGGLALLALLFVAGRRLADNGQFDPALWRPFVDDPRVVNRLWTGLRATLTAAAYALVLAALLGVVLAFGRLSPRWFVRTPATTVVEFFRATPLLLLILGLFLSFPLAFGVTLQPLWALVMGLTLYNGAVIAEIIRAGILALPKGQTEAALAIGLQGGQTLRIVLLPQAVRIMLPSLISQLVVLLKDTSLGFVIVYPELLRISNFVAQNLNNPIQVYTVVAAIYIVINLLLGRLASYVESRQRRKTSAPPAAAVPALMDDQVGRAMGS